MFQLVLDSIQKTVNFIAPPLDVEEEFKFHCQIIKEYFSNEQNLDEINNKVVEDTHIPKHLNMIMGMLLKDNERLFLSDKDSEDNQIFSGNQSAKNKQSLLNSSIKQEVANSELIQ
jgi:hypothetical protein